MVGSTSLAKVIDTEDLNEIPRAYYDICSEAIHHFDGIIANYMGDGIMALFGYARAHQDDAERAIHASFSEGFDTADLREARSLLNEVDGM